MTQKKRQIFCGIFLIIFSAILIASFLPLFLKVEQVHLIVLAGQSNCEGVSSCERLKQYVSAEKYKLFEKGFENVEIKNKTDTKFVKCKLGQGTNRDCFGLEIGMADYLTEHFAREKFYFVKRAHGGTPIFPYWNAEEENGQMGVNLRLLIEDVKKAIKQLQANRKKVVIDAVCWMQGESDADEMQKVDLYASRLKGLVDTLRNEFKDYNTQEIRFIDCGITDYKPAEVYFDKELNEAKRQFSQTNENNFYIDIDTLGLTKNLEPDVSFPDYWHFDSESMLKLGREFGSRIFEN